MRNPVDLLGHSIHGDDYYAPTRPANLFFYQQRSRRLIRLLSRAALLPLDGKRILDVGCGMGQQLVEFETWGARREHLAGIDINDQRVSRARARLCSSAKDGGADIRLGDAADLPWPNSIFDIVCQTVVFTSIPSAAWKKAVAAEMLRVLKRDGTIVWYDFLVNNPQNATVKGVRASEIRSLFPDCIVRLERITLAPPVARKLVPIAWMAAMLLEEMVFLNTHYLGTIRRRPAPGREG